MRQKDSPSQCCERRPVRFSRFQNVCLHSYTKKIANTRSCIQNRRVLDRSLPCSGVPNFHYATVFHDPQDNGPLRVGALLAAPPRSHHVHDHAAGQPHPQHQNVGTHKCAAHMNEQSNASTDTHESQGSLHWKEIKKIVGVWEWGGGSMETAVQFERRVAASGGRLPPLRASKIRTNSHQGRSEPMLQQTPPCRRNHLLSTLPTLLVSTPACVHRDTQT